MTVPIITGFARVIERTKFIYCEYSGDIRAIKGNSPFST